MLKKGVVLLAVAVVVTGCGIIGATKTLRTYSALMKAEKFLNNHQYMEAKNAAHDAMKMANDRWGKGHPETAVFLSGLGQVYREMGDYVMAASCFKEALVLNRGAGRMRSAINPISFRRTGNPSAMRVK